MLHTADAWQSCRRIEARHGAGKGTKCELWDRDRVADAMAERAVDL